MKKEEKELFEIEWDKWKEMRINSERASAKWLRQIKKDPQHITLEKKTKTCEKVLIQLRKERRAFRKMSIPSEIKELQEAAQQQYKHACELREKAFEEIEEEQKEKKEKQTSETADNTKEEITGDALDKIFVNETKPTTEEQEPIKKGAFWKKQFEKIRKQIAIEKEKELEEY